MRSRLASFSMEPRLRISAVTHLYPSDAEPNRGLVMVRHFSALAEFADVTIHCIAAEYPKGVRLLQPRTFHYRHASSLGPNTPLPGGIVSYPAFPLISRPWNGAVCARRLLPALRAARPDVILATFLYPDGFAALRCGQSLGIPVIVEAIGSDLRCVEGYWGRRWTRETVQQADFVITVSEELRCRALEFGASVDKVRVIRRGCDSEVFQLRDRRTARGSLDIPEEAQLILFVGRLVAVKGLPELLVAFADLTLKRPNLRLVCLGEGPQLADLLGLATKLKIGNRVEFTGALPPMAVARWFAACDTVCLPSHSEGLPNALVEALACGRPIVASDVGGIPELIDSRCGILVPPKNAARLARALDQALSSHWDERAIADRWHRTWREAALDVFSLCSAVRRIGKVLSTGAATA